MKPLIEKITDEIKFEYDNGVLKSVQSIGFNVDKERLTKALMDSRSFYNEGYEDAKEKYEQKWIPCRDRLPDELVPVNVTWINRKPEIYYEEIKDKPFTATAIYHKGKWYWWSAYCEDLIREFGKNDADLVDKYIDIIAWQPLPKSYEEKEEE